MKKFYAYLLKSAILLAMPGLSFAHHGPADDLGGQLVHATFYPSHLGVTLLAAGVIVLACRLAGVLRRRP